jgi:hypothetical protein
MMMIRRQLFRSAMTLLVALAGLGLFTATGIAQEDYAGVWTGTWDSAGAGSGTFELTLEKKDGGFGGKVAVTGEPSYNAALKTVKFEGTKMTATYDFPPDDRAEVALSATFEGGSAKGTWTVHAKDGGSEVYAGGWNVKRK